MESQICKKERKAPEMLNMWVNITFLKKTYMTVQRKVNKIAKSLV